MGALFGAAYFFFLPWVLSGILVSWLFAGPGRGHVRLVVVVGRSWPLPSGLGRPRDGPDLPHSLGGRHPRCAPSEPQATTASNDGGCADRLRTLVPRCTPPALATAPMPSTRASHHGRAATTTPEPSAWVARPQTPLSPASVKRGRLCLPGWCEWEAAGRESPARARFPGPNSSPFLSTRETPRP